MNEIGNCCRNDIPGPFYSRKSFDRSLQIALFAITLLGITFASLGGAGVMTRQWIAIATTIAVLSFISLVAYRCFRKNWLHDLYWQTLRNDDPETFKRILDTCFTRPYTRMIAEFQAEGLDGYSDTLAGYLILSDFHGARHGIPQRVNRMRLNNTLTEEEHQKWLLAYNRLLVLANSQPVDSIPVVAVEQQGY